MTKRPRVIEGDGPEADAPSSRREEILADAIRLFRERGFSATGMSDIGEAVGISGPAIYKHFANKAEILVEAFRLARKRVAEGMDEASRLPPDEALVVLVDAHIDMTLLYGTPRIWSHEQHELPEDFVAEERRGQRWYLNEWMVSLGRIRPELSAAQAMFLVECALSAIHSAVLFRRELPEEELRRNLRTVAFAVLEADLVTERSVTRSSDLGTE